MNIWRKIFQIMVCLGLSLIVGSVFAANSTSTTPKANPRYAIQGDTIYDKKTDLTWMRCSVGQKWVEGNGCVGVVKTYTFDAALRFQNGSWRVPTKEELATLIDRTRKAQQQKPAIDEGAFPDMDLEQLWYWTRTFTDDSGVWGVHFCDGSFIDNFYYDRSRTSAVRLVRDGK